MLKVLLIGSGFLASAIFSRLLAYNEISITVMDRKDPSGITSTNFDTWRAVQRYAPSLKYLDVYTGTLFGDDKRKTHFNFDFKDWINEKFNAQGYDIVIHAGSMYDTIYADVNQQEVLNINVKGLKNILDNLGKTDSNSRPLFIYISSLNVYGNQSLHPYDGITEDNSTPNPQDLLNFSLYTAENMLKSLSDSCEYDYIILRTANLIGYFTPISSLINSAMIALLTGQSEFAMYHANESIELIDINDFLNVIDTIIVKRHDKELDSIKNQVFNIRADEKEPKTVDLVIRSIYDTLYNLPVITEEHKIPGFKGNFKLTAPKIRYVFAYDKPRIKWDVPINTDKAQNLLGFGSSGGLVMSMIPKTVNYLLGYILEEKQVPETKRQILEKVFGLRSTPRPQSVQDSDLHNDVKAAVGDINKQIDDEFKANPV